MITINQKPFQRPEFNYVAALTQREDQQRLAGLYREIGLFRKAARVEACCDRVQLALTREGKPKIWPINHCHVRGCKHCGERRAFNLAKSYKPKAESLMQDGHRAQLITLTVPNCERLERPHLAAIMDALKNLRRQAIFKKVAASLATLEVTHGASGWHPHVNILSIGERIDQWRMASAWEPLSGGHIVDCRPVNQSDLVNVLRYITKPFTVQDSAELKELLSATAKMQMVRTAGALRGQSAETDWPEKSDSEMHLVGKVSSDDPIIADFLAGSYALGRAAGAWLN